MSSNRPATHRLKRALSAGLRRAGVPIDIDPATLQHHEQAIGDLFPAVQDSQAKVSDINGRLALVETHLPELLNTIASSAGALRLLRRDLDETGRELRALTDRIGWLEDFRDTAHPTELENLAEGIRGSWKRIETIRLETLLELRYGKGGRPAQEVVEPSIASPDKVERAVADGVVKLNLGCGHLPLDDYLNVDVRALPGVDIVAAIDELPFEPGGVDEIFSAHMLEHFPQSLLELRLLPYWMGLLRAGGVLRAVVPDGGALLGDFAAGTVDYDDFRKIVFGGQEYEGDFHYNLFTAGTLGGLLTEAGFVDVAIEAEGRMNDVCPELQISARRPD